MVRRRMRNDEDGEEEHVSAGPSGKKGKKVASDLKVSEMEDWADSEDEEMSDEDDDADEKPKKKAGAKGKKAPPKKKKKGSDDDEGLEDSDDGDEEGRELDYISDTSESGSEVEKEGDIKGVDQEEALRNLLESGSDSDEEKNENKEGSEEGEDEAGPSTNKNDENVESKDKKKKKKKKKKSEKKEAENLSDDDDDKTEDKADDKNDTGIESSLSAKLEAGLDKNSVNSRDETPDADSTSSSGKRKASSDLTGLAIGSSSKKPKMEVSSTLIQSAAAEGITEEAVRRYLLRKPMTVTELLHKFKSKKTKISSQDMVNVIAHILKKINPVKRMQNQKMYLYLTATKS